VSHGESHAARAADRNRASIAAMSCSGDAGLVINFRSLSAARADTGKDHQRRSVFVRRARELDFSLEDVRALVRLTGSRHETCGMVKTITEKHIVETFPHPLHAASGWSH
jgi:hypothetical protein